MKKLRIVCTFLSCAVLLTGCNPGAVLERFTSAGDPAVQEPVPDSTRVYMDEIHGTLEDFDGNRITLLNDQSTYVFDGA